VSQHCLPRATVWNELRDIHMGYTLEAAWACQKMLDIPPAHPTIA